MSKHHSGGYSETSENQTVYRGRYGLDQRLSLFAAARTVCEAVCNINASIAKSTTPAYAPYAARPTNVLVRSSLLAHLTLPSIVLLPPV